MRDSPKGTLVGSTNSSVPTLTVELCGKWCELWITRVTQEPEPVCFYGWDDWWDFVSGGSTYVDNVPNPRAVLEFARRNGLDIDPVALELIVGRWEIMVKCAYDVELERLG